MPFIEPKGLLLYHKNPPVDPILNHTLLKSHFNISLTLSLGSDILTKILHVFLTSSMHITCLVHFILLDLISLTISGEEYKL